MNRFFIPDVSAVSGRIIMDGDNARHAVSVLRVKAGDRLVVCDGAGRDYFCVVDSAGKYSAELRVEETRDNGNEPKTRIFIFQSLPKYDKLELITQKAVELGAAAIFPFQSERSISRISESFSEKRVRLEKIAESAAKQSHRGGIPEVHAAKNFAQAIETAVELTSCTVLAAHEKASVSLKDRLRSLAPGTNLAVFIGPEGGFSETEINEMEIAGIKTFSLGRRVLRTETAGLAAIANILYELE